MGGLLGIAAVLLSLPAAAAPLTVSDAPPLAQRSAALEKPDQLPQSLVARADNYVAEAWLAGPTTRYAHGVIGDDLEAARLVVRLKDGREIRHELPPTRVFEDLEPRLADLDGDGRNEIVVVETDSARGSRLSVYGVSEGRLALRAATAFLGQSQRWLNPVGIGDFDGNGRLDIAVIATPHIGGVLRIYRWAEPDLKPAVEFTGVTNHFIGTSELGLGRVVKGAPRDRILLPRQDRLSLVLLEWRQGGMAVIASSPLPARLASSLYPEAGNGWRARLANGGAILIQAE